MCVRSGAQQQLEVGKQTDGGDGHAARWRCREHPPVNVEGVGHLVRVRQGLGTGFRLVHAYRRSTAAASGTCELFRIGEGKLRTRLSTYVSGGAPACAQCI